MPFDIDCRDADYRRDPERPSAKACLGERSPAVRLVGADRPESLQENKNELHTQQQLKKAEE